MNVRSIDIHPARVLVFDEDPEFGRWIAGLLADQAHRAVWIRDAKEALERAARELFSAAVVDATTSHAGGPGFVERLKATSPDTQVIVLTGESDRKTALESVRCGAFDYLEKAKAPTHALERSVRGAILKSRQVRESRELFARLLGSDAVREVGGTNGAPGVAKELADLVTHVVGAAREACHLTTAGALLIERASTGWRSVSAAELGRRARNGGRPRSGRLTAREKSARGPGKP